MWQRSYLERLPFPKCDKDLESIVLKVVVVRAVGQPHLPGEVQQREEARESLVDVLHQPIED